LCSFLSRGKSPKYSDDDRTYPVFAQKCNLKDGGISLEQARFLDPSTINKWNEVYKLQTGDVLVNSTGTGTVGRTRLFNTKYLGNYPFVVPDSHVSVIRVSKSICPQYIYAYISSDSIQQYMEDNLAGSTNQKELYIGVLENMKIFLPPLTEQHRIVSKIEELFSSLDNIQKALEV
jgi:type I restriction enzyme S subunit